MSNNDYKLKVKSKLLWNINEKFDLSKCFDEKQGVVYFIGDVNKIYVKIGITTSILTISHRFRTLQGCSPLRLTLHGFIQTNQPKKLEKQLHQQFKTYNTHGEWFHYVPEITRYVSTNCTKIELANTLYGESYLSLEEIF